MPKTHCVVPQCTNSGDHIIPTDPDRRQAWINAIRRGKTKFEAWSPPSKFVNVCRGHFKEEDYIKLTYHGTSAERKTLKKNAIPSIFNWTPDQDTPRSRNNEKRKQRYESPSLQQRNLFIENKKRRLDINMNEIEVKSLNDDEIGVGNKEIVKTCENEPHKSITDENENTPGTLMSVSTQTPKQKLFSVEHFRNDDVGLHFYTGVENINKFYFILSTLGPAAYSLTYVFHNVVNITIPDQFFIVLLKLRRHTTNFELSRMFDISEKTVQNIFITWVNFMTKQWSEINIWPSRELVKYYAPTGFKKQYPTTRVIVDGTEFPIKKPKNPRSQQQTFSTYKNRNTVKVLVGSTPGGLISFVSSAYGGSASDRQITERSSLMTNCDPFDSIMADKGFSVQDLFDPQNVTVNMPTFFKKKNRLTGDVVMKDRKISSKRVHIERLIGLAKTFKILKESMTATEAKLSSEISYYVCFFLCNFRNCIVPRNA